MSLKVLAADGVKIYDLSSGKSMPDWIASRKKREKPTDQKIELLQDFNFPSACNKISTTADGQSIIAAGNYPPQLRIFDVANLSSKVTRHLDADIVDLQASLPLIYIHNRTLKFHAKFGHYYETSIPICGRSLKYVPFTAQLLVAGTSDCVHRLDLSEGKFLSPLETHLQSINTLDLSPVHGLLISGGSDGYIDCIDLREKSSVGHLDVAQTLQKTDVEVTAAKFDQSGYLLAAGTSDGMVSIFDLRSSKPLTTKDHMYDSPIHSIHFFSPDSRANGGQKDKVASADSFIVKIWDSNSGETYTNVESPKNAAINDMEWWSDSGLFFLACDDSRIQVDCSFRSFFVPSLGTAPKWCSFLESMTEELEEREGHSLYADYKFVTEEDLREVGLLHLIGTDLLKAYMHGYFIRERLYSKAKLINKTVVQSSPGEDRISMPRIAPGKKPKKPTVIDDRFKAVLEDPDFRVDESRQPHEIETLASLVEEDSLPFEQRTSEKTEKGSSKNLKGSIEFSFTPKSKKRKSKF